ncbi:MAG: SRPBCC family protein [Solirubrobacteraceae bacterium]
MTTESQLPSARVERVLPARPEKVYDAWLDERSLREFMCPAPGQATEVAVDARIGGSLRVVMTFPDRRSEITGEFVALDRPERVSFTWRTDAGDPESIVTVLLAPHGADQTHMTIIHSRQPPALVPGYHAGWTSVADRLRDHLAGE